MKTLKIKLNKLKINSFLLIRYFYPVSIIIILIILGGFLFFLYQNVYQTLAQAKTVTDLKQKVSEERLQKEKFDEIIEKINQKIIPSERNLNNINNPFENIITEPTEE